MHVCTHTHTHCMDGYTALHSLFHVAHIYTVAQNYCKGPANNVTCPSYKFTPLNWQILIVQLPQVRQLCRALSADCDRYICSVLFVAMHWRIDRIRLGN